jgi:hypothetical protein
MLAACTLCFSAPTLSAQQPGAIIIQMMMGRSGVAVPRHLITVITGATPVEVRARKNSVNYYTDARGIITLPLSAVGTGYIQVTIADMHPCELHPETASYSVTEIVAKGVMVPNKCPDAWTVKPTPNHLAVFVREFTPAEHAALKK